MASKFQVKVKGVQQAVKAFDRRKKKLQQLNTPVAKTLILLSAWVFRNFKTEGGKVGGWKELDEQTKARRKRRRRGKKEGFQILAETGALRQRWAFLFPRKNTGIFKSMSEYSRIHNEGGIGSKGQRIPKRRILPTDRETLGMAMKVHKGHVKVASK